MYDRPPPWCSHSRSMRYVDPAGPGRGGECWCEECEARWVLMWGPPKIDGSRVPTGWRYVGT